MCHASTLTLVRFSLSIKALRNSNLNIQTQKVYVMPIGLTQKVWGPDFSKSVWAHSHFASTPGGRVSAFFNLLPKAPNRLLRSAWDIWAGCVKLLIASRCSSDRTFTRLVLEPPVPLSSCKIPSRLTADSGRRRMDFGLGKNFSNETSSLFGWWANVSNTKTILN